MIGPFKGVVIERPYPPTGLTTARWRAEVETRVVSFAHLTLTQSGVRIGGLFGEAGEHAAADEFPHAVRWRSQLFLEDGHHRMVRWAMLGWDTARMRVFESND
jgi:hypothetical protein